MNCFILPFLLWRGALVSLSGTPAYTEPEERSAYVSIEQQVIVFMEGDREANLALVSTGRSPGYSTPRGDFSVLYKRWAPVSSTYRVRMPYWQCIEPSGAIGLHQASPSVEHRLGEALSHGCVRLGFFTARWAYFWLPVGSRVTIE
jgi:lipoprotein-anchoring transpeptidase ErfK/SrfK